MSMTPKNNKGFGEPENEAQIRRAKRINFFALLALLAMLITVFLFMRSLSQTKRELQLSEQLLKVQNDSLASMQSRQAKLIQELNYFKDELAKREQAAWGLVDSLSHLIEAKNYVTAKAVVKQHRKNEDDQPGAIHQPYINLYFYKSSKQMTQQVRDYINRKGFTTLQDETLKEMRKWLLDVCSVEYYDEEMADDATKIAADLTKITGIRFLVNQSLEVNDTETHIHWINVVAVGADASPEIRQSNAPYIQMQMEKMKR